MYSLTITWSQWNLSEYVFFYVEHKNIILIYIAKVKCLKSYEYERMIFTI